MPATKTTPTPLLKPNDMVRTSAGRPAVVEEVLTGHRRKIKYLDGGGDATVHRNDLTLELEAPVRPWRSRLP